MIDTSIETSLALMYEKHGAHMDALIDELIEDALEKVGIKDSVEESAIALYEAHAKKAVLNELKYRLQRFVKNRYDRNA